MIIGIDEVGYGPLAGPLVVVAVAGVEFLPHRVTSQLDDSKNLSPSKRQCLHDELVHHDKIIWVAAEAGVEEIEKTNILRAAHRAMVTAGQELLKKIAGDERWNSAPPQLLIDGNKLPAIWKGGGQRARQGEAPAATPLVRAVVRGDGIYASIAAAAIIAKVRRDATMANYHNQYPHYDFIKHKGYGTPHHLAMVKQWGPCPIHRPLFLRNIIA